MMKCFSLNFLKALSLASILLFVLTSAQEAGAATTFFQGHRFETQVVSDSYEQAAVSERWEGGKRILRVREGARYRLLVQNPLPVRVAAAVTIDGLNTIDGKRTTPEKAQKWIIEPYSSITIDGWQTSDSTLRRFYFTKPHYSYAQWKSWFDGEDYSKNLGVIGIAYFWNRRDLHRALYPPRPSPYTQEESLAAPEFGIRRDGGRTGALRRRDKAGTGMGRKEYHYVTRVNFHYDAGMYSNREILKIYYKLDHRRPRPLPQPICRPDYRHGPFEEDCLWRNDRDYEPQLRYAPEMP